MQAIILAAGLSRRLRPLTDTTPKCLLDVGGRNLLHRTIDNFRINNVNEFIIVTGYRENMIHDFVSRTFKDIKVEFLSNNDYENNNNSYSLWMTKNKVKGDIILADSDILFDSGIITKLLTSSFENAIALNSSVKADEEQIKVEMDKKGRVTAIGKHIELVKSKGESIGIEKFSSYFMDELFSILDRKILQEHNVNEFYEASFQEIIDGKSERNSIFSVDVAEYMCMEIDTVQDLENARELLKGNEKLL